MTSAVPSLSSPSHAAPSSGLDAPVSARSKRSIFVTEEAARFARKKLDARGTPNAVVRLGIRGGGCSGFSYVIQFEDEGPRERDSVFEFGDVKFVVDKKSLIYLAGSTLDYEKTLMFQGLKFKNPNEASSCGCGHSFTVK